MANSAGSPELSHEEEDQVEQVDTGEAELEDIINDVDEDAAGEIDVELDIEDEEEEEEEEVQEGLDLDMAEEEEGMGYHDDEEDDDVAYNDGEGRDGSIGYQENVFVKDVEEVERHEQKGANGDGKADTDAEAHHDFSPGASEDVAFQDKIADNKESELVHTKMMHIDDKLHVEDKSEENFEDPLVRPAHGAEVFIGGITKDTTEDDLKELCATCGDIFEVRLMKDKEKGDNKGFAFVTFMNKESAEKAIETLNEHELKGRKLRFSASQAKNKLFIGNVPKHWDKDELQRVLLERGVGITNVELLMDPQNNERNRGFSFVEYHNHACADNARRMLSMPGYKLGTNPPTVNWAEARGNIDNIAMSQVKVVYVRNLPESATQEQLYELFEPHGEISKVVLPQSKPGQPKRDFGFIHYADRSSALRAVEKGVKYEMEGRGLEASLAKPQVEKKPGAVNAPFGAGILPQLYPSRAGFGFDMYGVVGGGFGMNRGYGQPVIYGRGPAPAGMAMVPMLLPDGRMGYVLQQPGAQGIVAPYRDNRGGGRGSQSQRHSGGSSRRFRPY